MLNSKSWMKKAFNPTVLMLGVMSMTAPVFAGGATSGGGGSMVCRDANGRITSAELLDLWEVRFSPDNVMITRSDADVGQQLEQAVAKVKVNFGKEYAEQLKTRLAFVKERIKPVPLDVELSPPSDALNDLVQKGCKLEGVALFNDRRNVLHLNQEIYESLPETDKAALLVHEAVYWERRHNRNPDTNSIVSREFVGRLFSDYSWVSFTPSEVSEYLKPVAHKYNDVMANNGQIVMMKTNNGYITALKSVSLADLTPIRYANVGIKASSYLDLIDRSMTQEEFQEAEKMIRECATSPQNPSCRMTLDFNSGETTIGKSNPLRSAWAYPSIKDMIETEEFRAYSMQRFAKYYTTYVVSFGVAGSSSKYGAHMMSRDRVYSDYAPINLFDSTIKGHGKRQKIIFTQNVDITTGWARFNTEITPLDF